MSKKIFVTSIMPGMAVDSQFVIESPTLRTSKNGKYIACSISDNTGKISCKIWGSYNSNGNEIEDTCRIILDNEGCIFRVSGKADRYKDELNINVNDGIEYLKNPVDEKKITSSDYIYSPADIKGNKKKLLSICESVKNSGIKDLIITAIKNSDGFFEKPAAKTKHHNYTGGLCEHTLEVAEISQSIGECLAGVRLNLDILIAGAVLHDIGKCQTFEKKGLSYSPNPAYSLLGHITPAMQILSRYTAFVDSDTYQEILHIIQSHHGEHGETRPQTPEAWAVHFADNISATLHEISEDLKSAQPGELLWGKRMDGFVFRTNRTDNPSLDNKTDAINQKSQLTIADCLNPQNRE
ncbi:MAG: HD domain-containing protein [Methanomicrobiaceae archaeon]|nr:HD domain-containing protein [Methanomicrobiaceae archaeon]